MLHIAGGILLAVGVIALFPTIISTAIIIWKLIPILFSCVLLLTLLFLIFDPTVVIFFGTTFAVWLIFLGVMNARRYKHTSPPAPDTQTARLLLEQKQYVRHYTGMKLAHLERRLEKTVNGIQRIFQTDKNIVFAKKNDCLQIAIYREDCLISYYELSVEMTVRLNKKFRADQILPSYSLFYGSHDISINFRIDKFQNNHHSLSKKRSLPEFKKALVEMIKLDIENAGTHPV